jgi:hypothetical protein
MYKHNTPENNRIKFGIILFILAILSFVAFIDNASLFEYPSCSTYAAEHTFQDIAPAALTFWHGVFLPTAEDERAFHQARPTILSLLLLSKKAGRTE